MFHCVTQHKTGHSLKAMATIAMAAAVPEPIAGFDTRAPLRNTHAVKILKYEKNLRGYCGKVP
jgi:hypothetical protein